MRRKLSVHVTYEPLTMLLQSPSLPYFIMSALFIPQKPHYKSTLQVQMMTKSLELFLNYVMLKII